MDLKLGVMPLLKSIFTLTLILLVGFFSAGLPIEINDLLYIPVEQSISYSFQPAYTEVTNPHLVKFSMTSTSTTVTYKNNPGKNLKLEVFEDEKQIENFNFTEIIDESFGEELVISRDKPLVIQVDISQKTTRLPDGDYIFRFYSSNDKLKGIQPLELKVSYRSNPQYYKSLNYHPKDSMGLILYFVSKHNNYIIPVTRFVPYSPAILNATAKNLVSGADPATGLLDTAIVPEISKVYYSGSTVYVDINSQSEKLKGNPRLFYALDSIVYSMTEIPQMKRVQFLLDGKRVNEISRGITTSSPWSPETSPAAYLALNTFDRYLLFPYRPDTSEAKTIRDYAYILFETMRKGIADDPLVATVIPDEVELLNVYYINNTIKLDFNRAFLEAYRHDRQKQYIMMDSILFSFTTIPGVKYVKLMVEGNDEHTFADNKLTKPFTKPLYINPEKN
jgi:spore germination protein GerM